MAYSPTLTEHILNATGICDESPSPAKVAGKCPICGCRAERTYCSIDCYRVVQRSGDRATRFWSKVNKNGPIPRHRPELGPCWLWTGGKLGRDGYGGFSNGVKSSGGHPQPAYAHRVAWEFEHGPVPADKHILHHCDNPPCVRDAHLFLGDQDANMKDAASKGRLSVPRPRRQTIPDSDLARIHAMRATGATLRDIATALHCSVPFVSLYLKGERRQFGRPAHLKLVEKASGF